MKNYWRVIAMIGVLSLSAGAQNGTAPAHAQTPNNSLNTLAPGTSFHVELTKTLDAKKAKVGDTIQAKVTEDVWSHNTILAPKGSRFIGSVANVQTYTKENAKSTLGIAFEKFVLKDGREVPFQGAIVGYYPPTQLRTISTIGSNDDPQDRAAGPMSDGTGRVYYERRNQSPDLTNIPNMQRWAAESTHLSAGFSSTFSSSGGNVKLERSTILELRTQKK